MKMRSRDFLRLGLAALCSTLLAPHATGAPTPLISTLTVVPDKNYLHLELILNPSDLTFLSEFDANGDQRLDPEEWKGHGEEIARHILENLKLRVNDQLVTATIAGLSQSYESRHIAVRAHFAADARQAKVSLESQLPAVTRGSPVTRVNFDTGGRMRVARLDRQSNKVIFEPFDATGTPASIGSRAARSETSLGSTAFKANETAVLALLGLLLLAGAPPVFFCVFLTHRCASSNLLADSFNQLARLHLMEARHQAGETDHTPAQLAPGEPCVQLIGPS